MSEFDKENIQKRFTDLQKQLQSSDADQESIIKELAKCKSDISGLLNLVVSLKDPIIMEKAQNILFEIDENPEKFPLIKS